MTHIPSSLARYAAMMRDPRGRAEAEQAVGNLWRAHGLAVIWPDQCRDDWERQTVSAIATRIYGRRQHG